MSHSLFLPRGLSYRMFDMPSIYSHVVYGQRPKDAPAEDLPDIPQAEHMLESTAPTDSIESRPTQTSPAYETGVHDAPVQQPQAEATPLEALPIAGAVPIEGAVAQGPPAQEPSTHPCTADSRTAVVGSSSSCRTSSPRGRPAER